MAFFGGKDADVDMAIERDMKKQQEAGSSKYNDSKDDDDLDMGVPTTASAMPMMMPTPTASPRVGGAGGGAGPADAAVPPPPMMGVPAGRARRRRGPGLSLSQSLSVTHNSTRILDHIFLGGQEACTEKSTLSFLGISHILNVSVEVENLYPDSFTYKQIAIKDDVDQDLSPHFEAANKFLEDVKAAKSACLVHCLTGMSRSATFVLAHMIMSMKMSLKDALAHTKERRPRASPNPGFMAQLIDLEKRVLGTASVDLEKYRNHRFDEVATFEAD